MARLVFRGGDHAVVIRIADVLAGADGAESRIRVDLHVGRLVAAHGRIVDDHLRLVLVDEQSQLVAGAALVIHFQRKVVANPALDSEVVLVKVSAADVRVLGAEADQADERLATGIELHQRNILIETGRPGELSRLRHAGCLGGAQVVGRVQSHVGGNVVEDIVVADAESGANHRVVVAEQLLRETRRVGHSDYRREVVLVGVDAAVAEFDGRLRQDQRSGPTLVGSILKNWLVPSSTGPTPGIKFAAS